MELEVMVRFVREAHQPSSIVKSMVVKQVLAADMM